MIDEARLLLGSIKSNISHLNAMLAEKNDMIDLLSHDLRSPVGRILGLSSLIKTDDDIKKEVYADYITYECNGLLGVLENILLMLKEDSRPFRRMRVNLAALIDDAVRFFEFAASEKKLVIEVAIDEVIFIVVQKDLFIQALRNIIGNAIKILVGRKENLQIGPRRERSCHIVYSR